MTAIHIFSESAATGRRMRDILYPAGYAYITVSDLSALYTGYSGRQDGIMIIYAKTRIPDIIQIAADSGCPVILLLNPDCYAMYRDRAGHLGITLLLMPVSPYMLLDAVQEIAIS